MKIGLRMNLLGATVGAWFCGLGLGGGEAEAMILVENGQPKATIVVPAGAADPDTENPAARKVALAAEELQTYLEKISGAKLPLTTAADHPSGALILVGESPLTDAMSLEIPSGVTNARREEGFIIVCRGDRLVLAGNNDGPYLGTQFAVYDFLNRLGVRWYMPTEFGEVVPKRETITFPEIEVSEEPDFVKRNWWGPSPARRAPELAEAEVRWKTRNKMSTGGSMFATPTDGSVRNVVGSDEDFKAHPEYFALQPDGSRNRWVPSFTHPRAVEIAAGIIREHFRKNPSSNSYGFALGDGPGFDMSPETMKLNQGFLKPRGETIHNPLDISITEEWITFVNHVTAKVREEFPDVYIATNGYQNRLIPPQGVPLDDHLVIMFAPIGYCTLHAYDDPRCGMKKREGQMLKRWAEMCDNVWVYGYNYGMFQTGLTPIPMVHKLRRDFPLMKEWGVMGFLDEQREVWAECSIPSRYLRAQLEWDAHADVDAILDRFYSDWYGSAAEPMRGFYGALEEALENAPVHCSGDRVLSEVYRPELMSLLGEHIVQAERLADSERTILHVHVDRLIYEHLKAYVALRAAEDAGDFGAIGGHVETMLHLRKQLFEINPFFIGPDENEYASGVWYWGVQDRAHYFQGIADKISGKTGELVALLPEEAMFRTDLHDDGRFEEWYRPDLDLSEWDPIRTTRPFYVQGEYGFPFKGYVWYRLSVEVPAGIAGKKVVLCSPIGNPAVWCWVNGEYMGYRPEKQYASFEEPRPGGSGVRPSEIELDVTPGLRPGETNQITLRVKIPYTPDTFYDAGHGHVLGGIMSRLFLYSPRETG